MQELKRAEKFLLAKEKEKQAFNKYWSSKTLENKMAYLEARAVARRLNSKEEIKI